jgi:tripartite-type tricarboxylate transporter receptor subunit TctC
MNLRNVVSAITLCLLVVHTQSSMGADFPSKTIRLLTGYPASGTINLMARTFATRLSEAVKQPVVVENRPGALEIVALNALKESPPDGYTLLFCSSGISALPVLTKAYADRDIAQDLTFVSVIAEVPIVMVGAASAPYRSIDELVAYMRANPGKLNFAYGGGSTYLSYMLFKSITKTEFEFIRYGGIAPTHQALIAGDPVVTRDSITSARVVESTGKARILGIMLPQRSSLAPDIPALGESAMPELRALASVANHQGSSFTILGPARIPAPVLRALSDAVRTAAKHPEFEKFLGTQGAIPVGSSPEEFRDEFQRRVAGWKAIARDIKYQPEQ